MQILACHRLQTRTPRPPNVGPGPALQSCPGPSSRDGPQGHPLHPSLFSRGRQAGREQSPPSIHPGHMEAPGEPGSWSRAG